MNGRAASALRAQELGLTLIIHRAARWEVRLTLELDDYCVPPWRDQAPLPHDRRLIERGWTLKLAIFADGQASCVAERFPNRSGIKKRRSPIRL